VEALVNDPYREACSSCQALKAELEELRSTVFVYPSQGGKTPETICCVFCASILKWQNNREDWHCKKFERKEWISVGWLWWKKLVIKKLDEGCPPFPHLHRTCGACDGEWIEQPYISASGSRAT
jgi:hypothetical protein